MRLRAGNQVALAWLVAALLAASCGKTPRQTSAPADTAAALSSVPLTPNGLRATSVYFADSEAAHLLPVTRYLRPDSGLARGAVTALLAGAQADDPRGIGTAVPGGTRLLGISVRDSTATVDLSRAFESGAGSAGVRLRLAQLTYTLARLPNVGRVVVRIEGRPADVFSSEGLIVSGGLDPSEFPDLAPLDDDPPIVLTEPVPGSTVRGPLVLKGSANVFEAHVGLRVRGAEGAVVVSSWTTASCGTGCRGTFEKTIELPDSVRGVLMVEAFEPSAQDGSDLHLVRSRIQRVP